MAPTPDQAKRLKVKGLAPGAKQPKASVARYLKSTESQLVERRKATLLLKGVQCSQAMAQLLRELRSMQAPHAKLLNKKNQILPFQDASSLEFLTTKNDAALLALASHNKKRPHNLMLGRTFDHQLLDLCELGVLRYKSSLTDYPGTVPKKRVGSKPMLLFCGDLWQQDVNGDYAKLQNLLIDFYRGDVVDKLVPSGLDHIIVFTLAAPPQSNDVANNPNLQQQSKKYIVYQRTYFCQLKKDPNNPDSKTPVPYLQPCGPDLDLELRRTQWAEPDLYHAARKEPTANKPNKRKRKNLSTNIFGETVGRLHMTKQDLSAGGNVGRKVKALRRHERQEKLEEQRAIEQDLEQEMRN